MSVKLKSTLPDGHGSIAADLASISSQLREARDGQIVFVADTTDHTT